MQILLTIVISGLAVGAVYTLIAHAINVIYLSTRVLNFAQGELVMLGAMLGYTLLVKFSWSYWLTVPVVLIVVGVIAVVLERVAISPAKRHLASLGWLLSTLGAGIVMSNIAQIVWGRSPLRFPSLLSDQSIVLFGLEFVPQELLVLVASLVIMLLFELFRNYTLVGKAVKAISYSERFAQLSGIPTRRIISITFFVSGILSAIAGILVSPLTFASASMGFPIALKGFFAAISGGLGDSKGAMVAGLLLGVIEGLSAWFIAPWAREIVSYLIVLLVLVLRPRGLFASSVSEMRA